MATCGCALDGSTLRCFARRDAVAFGKIGLTCSAIISGSGEESGDSGNVRAREDVEPSSHVDLTCRARARIEALSDCNWSCTLD